MRLVVAFGVGALVLSVALATITFVVTRGYLLQQRERSAQRLAYVHASAVDEALNTRGVEPSEVLTGLRSASDTQSLLHYEGKWYASAVGVGPNEVPLGLSADVEAGKSVHQRIRLHGSPVLIVGLPVGDRAAQFYEIAPLQELDDTLQTLSTVLAVVAAGVTLFSAGLGLWTSRRLLLPLTRVAETSRAIADGRLQARIESPPDPELATLAVAFNNMAAALEARIERERRFTADVSHELRSPLTVLSAAVGALESRRADLSERDQAAVDLLSEETRSFSVLVEDLLEISRMDAGAALAMEPVRFAMIIVHAEKLATLRHPVRIEVPEAAMSTLVSGDKRRLERVVANLLDNADRYARAGIDVTLERLDPVNGAAAGELLLTVDDDGPGVPLEQRARIFDRFVRLADGARRGDGGAGLGLALVHQHVLAHGGTIEVGESPSGGARFVVRLPVHLPVWEEAGPPVPRTPSVRGAQQ